MAYIRRVKPWVVIGCPMCKMMSQLQNLSPWTAKKQDEEDTIKRQVDMILGFKED